jgi:hypothetical protein
MRIFSGPGDLGNELVAVIPGDMAMYKNRFIKRSLDA